MKSKNEKAEKSIGKRYERLVVLEIFKSTIPGKGAKARFICDCGAEKISCLSSIKSGRTKSCGCLNLEKITKHGFSKNKRNENLRLYQIKHQEKN